MIVNAARHRRALRISCGLTDSLLKLHGRIPLMPKPEQVIRVLKKAEVRFVLMGTHAILTFRDDVRATQDVDLLIVRRDHRKAIAAIRLAFPKLEMQDSLVVTRFVDPSTSHVVIDLMKPYTDLYKRVFKNTVAVGDDYLIPNLEMAIASKYAAMISPHRLQDKKYVDAGDFINIVRNNYDAINLNRLGRLGDHIHEDGGAELLRYVEDARAGRKLEI